VEVGVQSETEAEVGREEVEVGRQEVAGVPRPAAVRGPRGAAGELRPG
jgi:hypothetical protein